MARVTHTDEFGKRHDLRRHADTISDGKLILKKLLRQLEDSGPEIIEGDRLNFKRLAEIYSQSKIQPATYRNDAKVSGLRSHKTLKQHINALNNHFGAKLIRQITVSNIEAFKAERLNTPTHRGDERSIAHVNRTLSLMRAILNYAKREGWLTINPFEKGKSLIESSHEVKRDRILSREEEAKLLLACEIPSRAHIRPILIAALDTAMRFGELISLTWLDVDFPNGTLQVRAMTTKTMKARVVGMSARLRAELERLHAVAPPGKDTRVFGITDNIKKSFTAACTDAGIENFRFHDCRHTAITRWIEQGMPPLQVMAISGHTQMTTFARYVYADKTAVRRAAEAMDSFHARTGEPERPEIID